MRPKIFIWGASGHSLVVADILRLRAEFEIIGLLDDINPERKGTCFGGLPILGGAEQLGGLKREGATHLTFGFGDCAGRLRLAGVAEAAGFEFAEAIHPRAVVAGDVEVGRGTLIAAGAVVNPAVRIGRNAIINTSATVDHECALGEAVHIAPGSHLASRVTVGDGAWIGLGAVVGSGLTIGANSIVGAGAVITKDVPPGVVVYGVPGRIVRTVEEQRRRHR